MKKDNVQLTTAGKLLKDLKRYEKKHWDLNVIAWTDDDRIFGVVGTWKDENDAYTDILTLGEDEQFSFRSHLQSYNGSGFYKFESGYRQSVWGTGINDYSSEKVRMLFLHFSGRETETTL